MEELYFHTENLAGQSALTERDRWLAKLRLRMPPFNCVDTDSDTRRAVENAWAARSSIERRNAKILAIHSKY